MYTGETLSASFYNRYLIQLSTVISDTGMFLEGSRTSWYQVIRTMRVWLII